jgi:hypothetical protein
MMILIRNLIGDNFFEDAYGRKFVKYLKISIALKKIFFGLNLHVILAVIKIFSVKITCNFTKGTK